MRQAYDSNSAKTCRGGAGVLVPKTETVNVILMQETARKMKQTAMNMCTVKQELHAKTSTKLGTGVTQWLQWCKETKNKKRSWLKNRTDVRNQSRSECKCDTTGGKGFADRLKPDATKVFPPASTARHKVLDSVGQYKTTGVADSNRKHKSRHSYTDYHIVISHGPWVGKHSLATQRVL